MDNLKGIFDLPEVEGLNESERILARMCKKSFLSLWSYPNLHTDRDFQNGKGSAKELTDLLMVFGNHVVIFSDKHVKFQAHQSIEVAWKRWYRSAVADSCKQLYGAMSWLKKFPERIFIDAQCTRRPPVKIPALSDVRFHLVAVTRGSLLPCASYFPGSRGTLQIQSDLIGDEHVKYPFTVGRVDSSRQFIHVFDEFSLEVLLTELDTMTDFVEYLVKRELLLTSSKSILAAGEEQLLAVYLTNMVGNEHSFMPAIDNDVLADTVLFNESHFDKLIKREEYTRRKEANKKSYIWDNLIETFIRVGRPEYDYSDIEKTPSSIAQALLTLASESRFRRRNLIYALGDLFRAATPGKRVARLVASEQVAERTYVFLVQPKLDRESYEEYKWSRAQILRGYCCVTKLKFPNVKLVIGIAFDHPNKSYAGSSQCFIQYSCEEFTEEMREEAEWYQENFGILKNVMEEVGYSDTEFPSR